MKCTCGYKLVEKYQLPKVHGRLQTVCYKRKRLGNSNTGSENIQSEFGMGKCAMLKMKSKKRHMTDGMELPNQEEIRTLRDKETHKY